MPARVRAGLSRIPGIGGKRADPLCAKRCNRPGCAPATLPASDSPDRCTVPCCSIPSDEVVRQRIIWCDQRSEAQSRELENCFGRDTLIRLTCNPPLTNFTLTKLLWVRETEPQNWARVAHVMLPKDYVRFRLTGERAIDMADASGTLLLDVTNRRWSSEVLDKTGNRKETSCPRSSNRRRSAGKFLRPEQKRPDCGRELRLSPVREIRPLAQSAWESPARAPSAQRSEHQELCSPRLIVLRWIRTAACTLFATPFPDAGM